MDEAERIIRCASGSASWHTTASSKVIDQLNDRYDTQTIFCYGQMRKMVFEKITENHYNIRTVPA